MTNGFFGLLQVSKGADIKKLRVAVISTGNKDYINLFTKEALNSDFSMEDVLAEMAGQEDNVQV